MLRPRFIGLLLALLTLLAYLPVTKNGFVNYDDGSYITENATVQHGLTWAGIKWAFDGWRASNWHPVTWISHMLDYDMFGLNPWGHHFVNALFHVANVVLLFALLLKLTDALWCAFFIAALFGLHPMHVESVAWASERKDVLSTFFELLALIVYLNYAHQRTEIENSSETKSGVANRGYFLALILFALALMSKPMPVTMPFVMLLLDYWPLKRITFESDNRSNINRAAKLALEKWPFFLLSAASCVVTYLSQKGTAVVSLKGLPLDMRVDNMLVSYFRYLEKLIWPENLAVIYPLQNFFQWWEIIPAIVILVAISWFVWKARFSHPYLIVGWLWFLGTLVPAIGLVQVGSQAMADRYTYIPSVGIFVAIVFGARDLVGRYKVSKLAFYLPAVLILAACFTLTRIQASYWRNDIALFKHAAAVTKDNEIAHLNFGGALEKQKRYEEAMEQYREVLQINRSNAGAHNNLANVFDSIGKTNEARLEYEEAIRLSPKDSANHNNFGTFLVKYGQIDKALEQFAEAERLNPKDSHPYYLTGKALLLKGRDEEAIQQFRLAMKYAPNDFQMMTFIARVLASSNDSKIRDGQAAYNLASKANALTDGFQPAMRDTLAMAYAELGRYDDAQSAMQDAIALASKYKLTNDVVAMNERLALYKNQQPYRISYTNTAINLPLFIISQSD